ncbi:mitochondrial inner membrane protease ATP23 homolog [Argiope bruennichi]|uniref:Mitochondrial inner membrane protease ATP23 n=1 Tax=Argiope bruennichi TaxID=94029 RepID=A0A8T0FPX0_ARGBR|nr:mitochondrial inner membrane protease ATP23 homolog [Argiope bruennichi]KAF8792632.1 Mitochondrial inner membrane protease ATP23 like protein [Argiope bruennichi]
MSEETNPEQENINAETLGDPAGIDFFPERRGDKISRSWFRVLFLGEGRDNLQKVKCERQIHNVVSESPLIKLMMDALKSAGCGIDLNRHISCEPCSKVVTGGYDAEMNQIVVCQNTATSKAAVHGALAHEMVHMFDFCRAHVDFTNVDHLLCTEIRAANLMHCSFLSAMVMGTASLIRIKKQHQECVKRKALASVVAVRDLTEEEAKAAMNRVFTKCYNDLEPLGRRLRRNSNDIARIYRERYLYGYGHS